MTKEEFKRLPHLLAEADVVALGYSPRTIAKFVECGVLVKVKPAGCGAARYQKKQVAQMLQWEELLEPAGFMAEPPFMQIKAVHRWTGYSENTLAMIGKAGGIKFVKPPGAGTGKFLKSGVARLIGFEQYV